MPLIAFNYPDDVQRQWSAYQQNVALGGSSVYAAHGRERGEPRFRVPAFRRPPAWRPLRVYTDGAKTYIQFPQRDGFRLGAGAGRSRQ